MLTVVYDPFLAQLEKLFVDHFPPSWQVWSRLVDSTYEFTILGHEELFERRTLATIYIRKDGLQPNYVLGRYTTKSQIAIIESTLTCVIFELAQVK